MDGKSKKKKKAEKKFLGLTYCLLPIAFALIGIYYKPYYQPLQHEAPKTKDKPTYVIYDSTGPKSEALTLVGKILDRLGLQQIEVQSKGLKLEDIPMDWDLLWTWKHQRGNKLNWTNLKYYQKVNHWPGNYALASKSDLITKSNSKYIPKGFLTAESTREYAKEHPEKKFIIKKKSNRGIKIVDPKEMNFVETNSMDDYFAQEFVSNPLLWNGTKFDFSIYVLITSVDPLRLYYYDKNFILRFCKKPYNISNPDDVQSYAISDQQIPAQHFEGVKKYIDIESYSYKTAFDEFIKSTGKDIDEIWLKIEDLIRSVVMSKENIIINEVAKSKTSKYSYFELFRFDMMLDENFNLFLIEINMSPCLQPVSWRILDKDLYENLLYNIFSLIRVGTAYNKNSFTFPTHDYYRMVANPNGIGVRPDLCISDECLKCEDEKCKICWQCMQENSKYELTQAYLEQMHIGEFKRLFPPDKEFFDKADDEFWASLSEENKKHVTWYSEMCKKNKRFC